MAKQLPLNNLWSSLNTRFEIEDGWEIPSRFKNIPLDYKAAQHAGLIDFSHRGKIEVRGADRISFLHNILTNDIENLKPGQACSTALLSAPGKMLAFMRAFNLEDRVLLDMDPGLEEKLPALLDKYLITEDAEIKKASLIHLALCGSEAENILRLLQVPEITQPLQTVTANIQGKPVLVFKRRDSFYEILLEEQDSRLVLEILKAGEKSGLVPVGLRAAEILRIEAGELRYGLDMTEEIALPETGLEDLAASETKGCYPGQEVVARTKTYKGLQKKMTRLIFNGDVVPAAGTKIFNAEDGKEIGWVTSACYSPEIRKGLGLGYLRKGYFEKEQAVFVESDSLKLEGKTDVRAEVI